MSKIVSSMLCIMSFLFAGNYDSGYITYTQPNGSTFVGRSWGDEFIGWQETEDGYSFVKNGNGWYYYAILGADGDYVKSNKKVRIDTPLSVSYALKRSPLKIEEINTTIDLFNQELEGDELYYEELMNNSPTNQVEYKLGVVLVGFSDLEHGTSPATGFPYKTEIFDSLLFSKNG